MKNSKKIDADIKALAKMGFEIAKDLDIDGSNRMSLSVSSKKDVLRASVLNGGSLALEREQDWDKLYWSIHLKTGISNEEVIIPVGSVAKNFSDIQNLCGKLNDHIVVLNEVVSALIGRGKKISDDTKVIILLYSFVAIAIYLLWQLIPHPHTGGF
jgi:hypothetical protein